MTEYSDLEGYSFDDDWRAWLDNPPEDWAPPKGVRKIFTRINDHALTQRFVVRLDAWPDHNGLAMHFRTVRFIIKDEYVDENGEKRMMVESHKTVSAFHIPWRALLYLQDAVLDPEYPDRPNGKGPEDKDRL